MSVETTSIRANVEAVRERIARAAERAGRRPDEVTLVAVSKTFPVESIRQAYSAGVQHFGENRVQEWEQKRPLLADLGATWHLVGHLQSNKAARAARLFHTVDSVDSLSLAQKLARAMAQISAGPNSGIRTGGLASSSAGLGILIEVRLSPEETKSGVTETELPVLAEGILALAHLDLRGLMGIPPYLHRAEQVRPFFRRLRELRDALTARLKVPLPELSMGMSHDFEVGIEEGATQVRLGTAIFGQRASR
ncbi:MAG TPA: YggS family pyridoxal phosphate-dependent enzyme [Candidatus Acidoferrales bacterium]|nr:YggS family pyridoxal phosphate-dependent enzyme [Candidatus Acidoferrales bacterium]